MLLQKTGYPEENELVMCLVTNVQHHSVFCRLEEYGKSGMIHISEVSPGRIRNLKEYVEEGKVIVCKVLRISTEKGHIDLSLRRVSEMQRRNKISSMKNEQKAEKIIEYLAEVLKADAKKLYSEIWEKVSKDYDNLSDAFNDVVDKNVTFEELGLPKQLAQKLTEAVLQRLQPKEVCIKGVLSFRTTAAEGIDDIKSAVKEAIDNGAEIKYKGAGDFLLQVKARDYKAAEKLLKQSTEAAIKTLEGRGGTASFARAQA